MPQTMIVSHTSQPRSGLTDEDPIVVATPLDVIVRLQRPQQIRTVVLAGPHATNHELAAYLGEFYPSIHIECER